MKNVQSFSLSLLAPMLAALMVLSPQTVAAQELCGTQLPAEPVYPPPSKL